MATKLNSHGQLQEYLPSAGDEHGGEYATESYTNAHRGSDGSVSGEPPKVKNPPKQKTGEENMSVNNGGEVGKYKDFDNYVEKIANDGHITQEFKEGLKNCFNKGNENSKNIVNSLIQNGVSIAEEKKRGAYYSDGFNGVCISQSLVSERQGFYSKDEGQTFYHEFFHAVDYNYAKEKTNKLIKSLLTSNDRAHAIEKNNDYLFFYEPTLSACKVTSNGMTLWETIQKECRSLARNDGWQKLKQEFDDEKEKYVEERYPNHKEILSKYSSIMERLYEEGEQMFPTYFDEKGGWHTFYDKKKEHEQQEWAKPENSKIKDAHDKIRSLELQAHNEIAKSFMSLSDMYSISRKVPYGFCGGHKGNYASQIKGAIATEFMAEYGSCISRNSENAKKEMELYKKYMPESAKACQELIDMVIKTMKKEKPNE